ncbi:hypothetical protein AERO9A_210045 [Aeromonas salmonicida]|nr:hypothetical protein AERO9A_210045 [Aeromonas salmonicida]
MAATKMAQIVPLCSFISFVIHPLDAAQKVTAFGLGYVWLFFILNRCGMAGGVSDAISTDQGFAVLPRTGSSPARTLLWATDGRSGWRT